MIEVLFPFHGDPELMRLAVRSVQDQTLTTWRMIGWASRSLPPRPVDALTPLRMPLTQSFDQRTPHRFVVVAAPSIDANMSFSSSTRDVTRP